MNTINKEFLVSKYIELRDEVDRIEAEAKAATAELRAKMEKIETFFLAVSEQEGLKNINTNAGLVYFTDADNASVADPEAFFAFVKENEAWDMIQKRATTTSIRSYMTDTGLNVPGINFSSRRKVVIRRGK
jgi:hypothetical protein